MSALILIGLQNQFNEILTNDIINNIIKLVNRARQLNIPIIWIKSIYSNSITIRIRKMQQCFY